MTTALRCKWSTRYCLFSWSDHVPGIYSFILYVPCSTTDRLLTLTAYPFRIFHATRAFNKIAGRTVVGECFFDSFLQEGMMRPTVGTTLTPLGTSDIQINGRQHCRVQVYPVLSDSNKPNQGLLYYGVTIAEVVEQPVLKTPGYLEHRRLSVAAPSSAATHPCCFFLSAKQVASTQQNPTPLQNNDSV